jgi:acetyl esterase/lipase
VSADYRRAPECAFPAAVVDACNVAKDVWSVLDGRGLPYRSRLSIAGDSAGGALCATVAHKTQFDDDIDIGHQVLIYPSLDYTLSMPSVEDDGVGYLLEKDKILWYFDHYFQHMENRRAASPLYMEFTKKLPKTLVVTAEFCPLRDEGRSYVQRIQSAGIYAQNLHFDHMIHAFLNMEDLAKEVCKTVYQAIGDFLSR